MAKADSNLLTAAKWAEKFGASPAKFKKAILELNIEPDLVKGPCNYYSEQTAEKIKSAIK